MRLLIIFLSAYCTALQAQEECGARQYFLNHRECGMEGHGARCVELDISHSIDKEGKSFIYEWNFGDGKVLSGPMTEYCYEQYGTYQITMDLLDPETRMIIRNELSTKISLLPPVEFATDTLQQMTAVFKYDPELLPGIAVEKVYWKIENEYYCGEQARHSFGQPGFHLIEIGVLGKTPDKMFFSGCTFRGAFITTKP
jgi:PKD domain